MIDLAGEYWPFGRVRVRPSGFFVPDPAGVEMTIVPVEAGNGRVVDLCAYQLDMPHRWWLRTGCGTVLGAQALELAHDYRLPVILVDKPHRWISHPSPWSVCVLQPSRAAALLAGVRTIRERRRHGA